VHEQGDFVRSGSSRRPGSFRMEAPAGQAVVMIEPTRSRSPKQRRRRRDLLAPAMALLACSAAGLLLSRLAVGEERWPSRRYLQDEAEHSHPAELSLVSLVLGSAECNTKYDTTAGMVVQFLLIIYTFLGLAIVCDEYFVESLEQISNALNLSDDVAGATFMAAGSSAPELFTAVITIFIAPGEQGVGTIVGSAVFNICVIIGLTALFAGQTLQLWWYPLMRDSSVYGLSILGMVWAMYDKQVTLFESSALVSIYLFYVLLMVFNNQISDWISQQEALAAARKAVEKSFELKVTPFKRFIGMNPRLKPEFRLASTRETELKRIKQRAIMNKLVSTALTVNKAKNKWIERISSRKSDTASQASNDADNLVPGDEADEDEGEPTCIERFFGIIGFPLTLMMKYTIPDCRIDERKHLYPLTFTMSIVWIGLLSFLMVDFAGRAGCIIGVPEFLMGLVVLSVGTSVPDALSSILVARNGQGNMAVCNVLGSNVFNILLGLGLPWLIANLMYGKPYYTGDTSIVEPALILFAYLFALILILVVFKWQLSGQMGVLLLVLQCFYWGYNVAEEYDVVSISSLWASLGL